MFVGITNTPREYAWGSTTAIASLLGRQPSGRPEAELWLGDHPQSPAAIVGASVGEGAADLASWIASSPHVALGSHARRPPRLPFLMKVLAAAAPLSLQAHPSPEQARAGFDLENEAGIPLDAPDRNYRDPFHKPELVFALSETFEALCGFRDADAVRDVLDELRALDASHEDPQPAALDALASRLSGRDGLREVVDWLLRDGRGEDSGEVDWLVERVVLLARHARYLADGGAAVRFLPELSTVHELATAYPGDPGIVLSLLLNRVSLRRGEALYLPAGNIHAYLSGLGIEVMAASDNVLRGGLTRKHIDVDEVLSVLDFTPLPVPYLPPVIQGDGVTAYRPGVPDFELVHISADAVAAGSGPVAPPMRRVALRGPAIALCTTGGFLIAGDSSSHRIARGEAVFISPDEGALTFAGSGEVFLASTGE